MRTWNMLRRFKNIQADTLRKERGVQAGRFRILHKVWSSKEPPATQGSRPSTEVGWCDLKGKTWKKNINWYDIFKQERLSSQINRAIPTTVLNPTKAVKLEYEKTRVHQCTAVRGPGSSTYKDMKRENYVFFFKMTEEHWSSTCWAFG